MFNKYFTLQEANDCLPLVKRVVDEIVEYNKRIKSLIGNTRLTGKAELIEQYEERVDEFVKELEDLGCFYEACPSGLGVVDFPAIYDEECVFWCWRSDEKDVQWYHNIEEDWQRRQLIPQHFISQC